LSDENDAAAAEDDAAPDMMELARDKLRTFFRLPRLGRRGAQLLGGLALGLWLVSGIYLVHPDEQGMVLRFGQWVETAEPGLHYHLPYPIETVALPSVTQVNQLQIGLADKMATRQSIQMLTGDENILEANYVVFWKIKDPAQFLFKLYDPEDMVRMAAESMMREVVSRFPIQAVLSDKRQQVAEQAREGLQKLLDSYQTGIQIREVQLLRVDPPAAVIDAFNDVQRARADQERARNEADAYRNDILPRARGEAQRITQEAEAYKTQVIDLATGETSSYRAIQDVYRQAPEVVSWRLYLEGMDDLLRRSKSVLVDVSGKGVGPVQPYAPLDLLKPATPAPAGGTK
jgi:modulator of FtsH protease HflK